MIIVNCIIRSDSKNITGAVGHFRVVGIRNGDAYLVSLDADGQKVPFACQLSLLNVALGYTIHIVEDFVIDLPRSIEQLSDKGKSMLEEIRQLMLPITEDEEILFRSDYRGRAFRNRATETGKSSRNIRRLFNGFLWGGRTLLALAKYIHTGDPKQQSPNTAKRGPKSKNPFKESNFALSDVREKLKKGAKKYYKPGKYTFTEAYVRTIDEYFTAVKRLKSAKTRSLDEIKKNLPPASERPTERQFRYICDLLTLEHGSRTKLPRKMRPEEEQKVRRGKVRDHVPGPGYRFEIDSTKVQVDLVSIFNRSWVIGNATLYIVVDVWSSAIVGYAISLENSKWDVASQCLENCFSDKTATFKRLKLPYSKDDCVFHQMPTNLAADRAEFLTNKATNFYGLNIRVEILPPMRPDLKPLVESAFAEIKHGHFFSTPGKYAKFLKRREKDGKNMAAMTLDEFEEIIVEIIMGINNDPRNVTNIPIEMLKEDHPNITRMGIYKWGLENLPGYTRTMSSEDVKSFLMIADTATVKPDGLYFKEQRYISPQLLAGGQQATATKYGQYQIEIRYRGWPIDQIWFLDEKNNKWELATIADDSELFKHLCVEEFEFLQKYKHHLIDEQKTSNILHKFYRNSELMEKVKKYRLLTREARLRNPGSNSNSKIRSHRRIEILGRQMRERFKNSGELIPQARTVATEPVNRPAWPSSC